MKDPSLEAVVGLGANVGDRLATMQRALTLLAQSAALQKVSNVFESAPVGGPAAQPDYLNAAVKLIWRGTPLELLDTLLAIENRLGRVRAEPSGPRTIDLDLLWIRGIAVASGRLSVPHPRLLERSFAVRPLLEVAPDATDPRSGAPIEVPSHLGDVRWSALRLVLPTEPTSGKAEGA